MSKENKNSFVEVLDQNFTNNQQTTEVNQKDEKPTVKLFQFETWEGASKFFAAGHLMTGPHPKKILLTFGLLNIPSLFFGCFTLRHFFHNDRVASATLALILLFLCNFLLFRTALGDPGFIPRG